jgi:Mg-chelatase subunit ChlD
MKPVRRGLDTQVITDARRIVGEPEGSEYVPTDARELCGRIMHTCYMGTENSSAETRGRARELAEAIGRSVYLRLPLSGTQQCRNA